MCFRGVLWVGDIFICCVKCFVCILWHAVKWQISMLTIFYPWTIKCLMCTCLHACCRFSVKLHYTDLSEQKYVSWWRIQTWTNQSLKLYIKMWPWMVNPWRCYRITNVSGKKARLITVWQSLKKRGWRENSMTGDWRLCKLPYKSMVSSD